MSYDIFMNVYNVFKPFFLPILFLCPILSLLFPFLPYIFRNLPFCLMASFFPPKKSMKNISIFIRKVKNQNFLETSLPPNQDGCNKPANTNAGEDVREIPYLLLVGVEIHPTTVQITVEE